MKHQLTEIREAAVALLKTKFRRVYHNRTIAPAQSELPCVVVYIDGRRSERQGISPIYRHDVRLVIMLCVQANESADTVAESMLKDVETLFFRHPDLQLQQFEIEDLEPENLQIAYDDSGEKVTAYYQQGWRLVCFESVEAV